MSARAARLRELVPNGPWQTTDGPLMYEDLVEVVYDLRRGANPFSKFGTRSDRRWDRAAQLLRKAGLIAYRSGRWALTDQGEALP